MAKARKPGITKLIIIVSDYNSKINIHESLLMWITTEQINNRGEVTVGYRHLFYRRMLAMTVEGIREAENLHYNYSNNCYRGKVHG